jgi:hypothetical protein
MRIVVSALACTSLFVVFACGGDDSGGGPTSGPDGGTDGSSIDGPVDPNGDGGAVDPACTDGVKGPGEADIDCGGKCAPCANGKTCTADSDCDSDACENGACFPTAVCGESGFCFENPKPSGGWWHSTWGATSNDVWIAGGAGKAVRWNGKHFLAYDIGVNSFVFQIAGADATHVWAITDSGAIVFFDGTKWSQQSTTTTQLRSLSVSGTQNAWAVGQNGTILKYDGATWSQVTPNVAFTSGYAIYTTSATDVWAGGGNQIIHWNGATWSTETTGASRAETIFGAGGNVWASDSGSIYKRDGTSWTPQATGLSPGVAYGYAVDATHAYAVGYGVVYELTGSTWAPMSGATGSYRSIFGLAPNDLWAVGTSGTIERFDGAAWKDQRTYANAGDLRGVAGTSLSHVVAVGPTGKVLRRKGSSWVEETVVDPNDGPVGDSFNGVWTSGPTNTVIVGNNGKIFRHDGTGWKREQLPDDFEPSWHGISGSSASSVWVVGSEGASGKYDGTKWTRVTTGVNAQLAGVWNVDATNTWAVGFDGTILHHDGVVWKPETSPTPSEIHAVWASDAAHVFAAASLGTGNSNLLVRANGTWGFGPDPADGSNHFYGIGGHSMNDVWLGGVGGAGLWHYDGAKLARFDEPGVNVNAVAAVGSSTFIVGENGYVLHRR